MSWSLKHLSGRWKRKNVRGEKGRVDTKNNMIKRPTMPAYAPTPRPPPAKKQDD